MTDYNAMLTLTKELARDSDNYAYDLIGVIDTGGECKCRSCATDTEIATMSAIYSDDDPLFAYSECIACGYPLKED